MHDSELVVLSIILIILGVGIICSIKDEVSILAPLAGLGAGAVILMGIILLVVSVIHLI